MVWVDASRNAKRRAAKGTSGMSTIRYGYGPRAECQDCEFALKRNGAVGKRGDPVRMAAQQHAAETGHEVHVIVQDVTRYKPTRRPADSGDEP